MEDRIRGLVESPTPLLEWLQRHQATDDVVQILLDWGLETRADLATYFCQPPDDVEVRRLWHLARDIPFVDVAAAVRVAAQAEYSIQTDKSIVRQPAISVRRPFCQGVKKSAIPKNAAEATEAKLPVARELITLSWSWAPEAGLAASLPAALVHVAQHRRDMCVLLRFDLGWLRSIARLWHAVEAWMQGLNITKDHWPLPPACVEDFLDRSLTDSSGSSGRALLSKLKWTVAHLCAPLKLDGVILPTPLRLGKGRAQAVVAEPCMVAAIWRRFHLENKANTWRRVVLAVAVCASVKPLRYARALRSRPIAKTTWWMAFWAYQGKVRTDGVLRGGFYWFVPLVTPTLREAANLLWDTWTRVWKKTDGDSHCVVVDANTLEPVPTRVFNRVLHECVSDHISPNNRARCTSYSLRRYQPTLLDVRKAPLPERMALGGWVDNGVRADNIMPLRYAGTKMHAELEIAVVQALFTATTLLTCRTWEDVRCWWQLNGAAQEVVWRQRYHELLVQTQVTLALGANQGEVTVLEPRFALAGSDKPVSLQLGESRSGPDAMDAEYSWIASQRKRSLVRMEFEGRPRCAWKQAKRTSCFKGSFFVVHSLLEAVALQRDFCKNCLPWLRLEVLRELQDLVPNLGR